MGWEWGMRSECRKMVLERLAHMWVSGVPGGTRRKKPREWSGRIWGSKLAGGKSSWGNNEGWE
jgi:hypothetical protein